MINGLSPPLPFDVYLFRHLLEADTPKKSQFSHFNAIFLPMWFKDPKWTEAAEACLSIKSDFDWILTPHEFHGLSKNFRPLEYSEAPPPGKIAFLAHKDLPENVSEKFRRNSMKVENYLFANEVFVLGTTEPVVTPDQAFQSHLGSWFAGGANTEGNRGRVHHTEFRKENSPGGKKALIVGASRFGNIGDDLLGEAAANLLLGTGKYQVVHLSDFNVSKAVLGDYDEIFVGGGGLLYASQIGCVDWQNLANYFKIPFWCEELSRPCHLLAVGHQEPGQILEQDDPTRLFLRESLRKFKTITLRDHETAGLIRQISERNSIVGADLVFSFPTPEETPADPVGILLIGEVFHYPALGAWLQKGNEQNQDRGRRGFAVMSNDDEPHLQRLKELFGDELQVHDFRELSAPQIIACLQSYKLVVGTRFHGFVLGLKAGARQIVFDRREGKKHRLIRSIFPELQGQLLFQDAALQEVEALLSPAGFESLTQVDPRALAAHSETVRNHLPQEPAHAATVPFRLSREHRKVLQETLLNKNGEIKLCWAASSAGSNGYANLGDGLSAFMIGNLAGLPVRHTNFQEDTTRLFGVGSIGHAAKNGHAVIWGTGCYRPDILINNVKDTTYDVLAVRGNISQQCLESVGIRAPHCYGEPVWLLPSMFSEPVEKKYELGVICHISDLKTSAPDALPKDEWSSLEIPDLLKSSVILINTWHAADLKGMLDKLRLIRSCKRIASRSFHGVVIAEAYGIPCIPLCSKPGVPSGAFSSDAVKLAMLDRRTLEFFNSGNRRPQHFYGQRRGIATDWESLMSTIDRIWSPIGYDATPMLESFPFEIPADPINNRVRIHPSMEKMVF